MKPKTLILMVVAVGCALLAALVVSRLSGGGAAGGDLVWVARQVDKNPEVAIPVGHYIGDHPEQVFEQKGLPADAVPLNAIRNIEDLKKKFVVQSMVKGTVCTLKNIGDVRDFSQEMEKGNLAQSVSVTNASGGGGFVKPGSKVNVLATMQLPGQAFRETRPILQNVKVLAVNTVDTLPDGTKTINPNVIVLEVTPEDDIKLVNAIAHGTISLALRNPKDDSKAKLDVPAPKGEEKAKVDALVAKKDIIEKTEINAANFADYFETRNLEADLVPAEAIRTMDALLKHKKVERFLAKGNFPTEGNFQAGKVETKAGPGPVAKVANVPAPPEDTFDQSIWTGPNELKIRWVKRNGKWSKEAANAPTSRPEPQPVGGGSEGKS